MSEVRLFRRRRGGRPAGPWIAWGYDAQGRRWSESTKQIDEKAARDVARELERRHASPAAARAAASTLADAVTLLLADRRGRAKVGKRSDATVTFYEQKTGHWRRILGDAFRLADLDAPTVDRVIEVRREDGATEHTIAKELVALRCALKLARRAGIWAGDPAALLPVAFSTEYSPRERWLPFAELQKLLAELPPVGAALVAFIVATGARWSEAASVRLDEIDPRGMVRLRGTKTEKSDRWVPVVDAEGRMLLSYALEHAATARAEARAAGWEPDGGAFPPWLSPNNALRRACERARIAHASFNDLRRTFAQRLRQAGAAPDLIAPAMGHTTTQMVQRVYGRLDPQALAALLGGVFGMQPSAADMQQTLLHSADSMDGSDTPETRKALETRAFVVGHEGLEPSANGLRVRQQPTDDSRETPSAKVLPLLPRPRRLRGAADVQQGDAKTSKTSKATKG